METLQTKERSAGRELPWGYCRRYALCSLLSGDSHPLDAVWDFDFL
jgi:hypothetical protein